MTVVAPINLLLASLPPASRASLNERLEAVVLPVGKVLYEPDEIPAYVHFITSGMACIVNTMTAGEAVEVGVVTLEGMPESLHLLGKGSVSSKCFMQITGTGLRMRFQDFHRQFRSDPALRDSILRLVQCNVLILSQIAACNRIHSLEERLARWVLTTCDRMGSLQVRLTHEFLSQMLGTSRSTVSTIAGQLQRAGLIQYRPGVVTVADRAGLEDIGCECYGIIRGLLASLSTSYWEGQLSSSI